MSAIGKMNAAGDCKAIKLLSLKRFSVALIRNKNGTSLVFKTKNNIVLKYLLARAVGVAVGRR